MDTDYMDALRELDEIVTDVDTRDEQQRDFESVDDNNPREIWEYIAKWYEPRNPRYGLLCHLGLHKYRGYTVEKLIGWERCSMYYGVCTRCGNAYKSGWRA